ncbi:hypothetical protein Q9L58_009305 [Maublancomyces gigas]|uniref:Uncharacterized protein n=1 Tax=Discina gigas TaxID=1032678 RepID=A0ABR3G7N3_9PEZI
MDGSASNTPTPEGEIITPADGLITGQSCLGVYDPVINPGHVLPESPPLHHDLDRTWNGLLARLELIASTVAPAEIETAIPVAAEPVVRGFTRAELKWVAGCTRGARRRCEADPVRFWGAAAERFSGRFGREISGRAIRRQFLKLERAGGAGGAKGAKGAKASGAGGIGGMYLEAGASAMEGVEFSG